MPHPTRRCTLDHTVRRKTELPRLFIEPGPGIPMILRQIGPAKTPTRPRRHIHLHP